MLDMLRNNILHVTLFAISCAFIAIGKPHSQPQRLEKKVSKPNPESETMRFYGYPPRLPEEFVGNAWYIYATGVIDDGAAKRLKSFLEKNDVPPNSLIYFNSIGGSLLEGIKIGQIIREAGLFSYVGRIDGPKIQSAPGQCLSACALAFLGGKFRWINSTSSYGVHRFRFASKESEDVDVTQMLSAIIIQYIRDMGADPKLYSEMSAAGSDTISILTENQLKELKVTYNGYENTHWTVEAIENSFYLKGERETWRGMNKFLLFCGNNYPLSALAIFDPEGRGDEVLQMKAFSIVIDGNPIPIPTTQREKPGIHNGWINMAFSLDKDLVSKLFNATTLGIYFQYSYGAPVFLGFDSMDFSDGLKKLPALIKNCQSK